MKKINVYLFNLKILIAFKKIYKMKCKCKYLPQNRGFINSLTLVAFWYFQLKKIIIIEVAYYKCTIFFSIK